MIPNRGVVPPHAPHAREVTLSHKHRHVPRLAARLSRSVYSCVPDVYDASTDAQARIIRSDPSIEPFDVAVVFRGTDSIRDWLYNLDVLSADLGFVTRDLVEHRVHRGFLHQYASIREPLLEAAVPVGPREDGRRPRVLVTGHSLGGALAHIAAVDISRAAPDAEVSVVTFGSPRVMSPGSDPLFEAPIECVRYTHGLDPVPFVPLPVRFRHVGRHVPLSSCRGNWPSLTNPVADHDMELYERALSQHSTGVDSVDA